jgi:hypothetical protein
MDIDIFRAAASGDLARERPERITEMDERGRIALLVAAQ